MKNKHRRAPWNKGKLVGQKAPLKLKELWAIRVRLQLSGHTRNLALFNLAIDSKLRGCDLVCLRIRDVSRGRSISTRAIVLQRKTHRPVQFEVSEQTRTALLSWIHSTRLGLADFLFPGGRGRDTHLSTRQYARIVDAWVASVGLDPHAYGTQSMRRTRRRSSIDRPKTCERYSCSWDIPNLRAPSGIWESRWRTRLNWLSR